MTPLDAVVFFAVTSMFFGAAVLIIKGGRAEAPKSLQSSLHAMGRRHANRLT